MVFNSLEYLIFLPIVFIIYWFLLKNNRNYQNAFLLLVSYVFYASWNWKFLFLLIFLTVLDFGMGLKIEKSNAKIWRKIWLIFSVGINLGFLGLFKYNPIGFVKSLPNLFAFNDLQLNKDYINMYGSFQASDSIIISTQIHQSKYFNIASRIQLKYLGKIIDLCIMKNIKPILITTPLHKCIERNSKLEQIILNFVDQYRLSYFNNRNMDLPDSFYRNSSHLNTNGAKYYTNYLFNILYK